MRPVKCVVSAVIILFLIAGCIGKNGKTNNKAESAFSYHINTNLVTFDPGKTVNHATFHVFSQIFAGLVQMGQQGEVLPALAGRWDLSKDKKTYIFYLRSNIKFSNGKPITAEDFKWTFERNCDPSLRSTSAPVYLSDIDGVNEKLSGKSKQISGIQVLNARTLKIKLNEARPYFLSKLTNPVSAVLCKANVPTKEINNISQMIGAGAFSMKEYYRDHLIILKSNPYYYGEKSFVDQLKIFIMPDSTTSLNKYKADKLDMCPLPIIELKSIREDPLLKSELQSADEAAIYYIVFNPKSYKPFLDQRVRKAFIMGINRKMIIEEILHGDVFLENGLIPYGIMGHRRQTAIDDFNPEKAKQLLTEAGYSNPKDLSVTISLSSGAPSSSKMMEAIAQQLKQNLGINVNVIPLEIGTFNQKRSQCKLDLYMDSCIMSYMDPANFLSDLFTSHSALNFIHYSNPQFDSLCYEADRIFDYKSRIKLYQKAEDTLLKDCVILPIFSRKNFFLLKNRVSGLRRTPNGFMPHTKVKINGN